MADRDIRVRLHVNDDNYRAGIRAAKASVAALRKDLRVPMPAFLRWGLVGLGVIWLVAFVSMLLGSHDAISAVVGIAVPVAVVLTVWYWPVKWSRRG